MESKKLVMIDTDCGVDDARAIVMALSSYATDKKAWKVLAITTVNGNTQLNNVNENVLKVLHVCERSDVPVYQGSKSNLTGRKCIADGYHGEDGLGNVGHEFSKGELKLKEENGIVKMTELAKQYKGQITMIALGPLTNLALAQRIDPDFTSNLKEIVLMGGNVRGEGNVTSSGEFNFYTDPDAADIILKESSCKITIIPWETCIAHTLRTWSEYEKWLSIGTKKANFIRKIGEFLKKRRIESKSIREFYCCDSLAVAVAIDATCATKSITCYARVETRSELSRGLVVTDLRYHCPKASNVTIVTEYDKEKVLELSKNMLH